MTDKFSLNNPFENIPNPEEETQQINETASITVKLLDKRYPSPKKILRGVHPKSHGCVKATFKIREDVDKKFQVGLFANPGKKYRAWVRFSNAAVRVTHDLKDGKNGSRGMAIKVLSVKDDVLPGDKGVNNQDFLMINTPAFAFANAQDYLRLTKIILETNDNPAPFFAPLQGPLPEGFTEADKLRILRSFQIVKEIESKPVANPLEIQYFSAAPFLFGADRVMKFSAEPVGGEKQQILPEDPSGNYLHESLIARMGEKEDVCFDFKIQVRDKDETGLDIEDATAVWDEEKIPFINVAEIIIPTPQKNIDSPKNIKECEKLVFTPWHSLAEHQPLGSINRLRKEVYLASKNHRDTGK